MEENETYIVMTSQVPTETINNSAYEGVTSNSEETEGATHYTNGDFQVDTNIYECIWTSTDWQDYFLVSFIHNALCIAI